MHRFLISGTDTGVGKTTVARALATAMTQRGLRVAVMKPAETGCELHDGELLALDALALRTAAHPNHTRPADTQSDAARRDNTQSRDGEPLALDVLVSRCGAHSDDADSDDTQSEVAIDLICPYRYATPLAPAAAAIVEGIDPPDLRRIASIHERLSANCDVTLVEGAGGLAVPITWRENYADLALALDLELILVVANRLGCINATVLSISYATQRGVRIKGYILNDIEAEPSPAALTNAHSLETLLPGLCLGAMKYRQPLPAEILPRLLR
ncbi:MAG: dethiobiotin synthase [Deltaproteobacteria bacterium]|nr:dethiobiotin synthase [Deltaproteobacteria bacterium]